MVFKYFKFVCVIVIIGVFKCLVKMVFKFKRVFKKNFGVYFKLMIKLCVDCNLL